MTTTAFNGDWNHTEEESQMPCATMPGRAIVALTAGMIAAWFAAGSTGLLAHPLQHTFTWLALAVAIIAAWPENSRNFGTWAIFAIGAGVAACFTASTVPAVNVLAVAVVLAALAQINRGQTNRLLFIAALGATTLGCFRLACAAIPLIWTAADRLGWLLGSIAGLLTGQRLEVGATFGGVDFLVFVGTVYIALLLYTPPPRRRRAVWAAVAIIFGHLVYLMLLAYSEKLTNLLPEMVVTPKSDMNNVGVWTWSNGLRSLIPWNMPLMAMLIHCGIVAAMVGVAPWLPIVEIDPRELERQKEKEAKEDIPGFVLVKDMLFNFCPTLLAVMAAASIAWATNSSNLKGKTIVAYEKGNLNWLKPEYGSSEAGLYGMLPTFVKSLGGNFVVSKNLSSEDLATADVLLLIHPNQPWPKETLERVWAYVERGGSLLLVAEPGDASSVFNELLKPSAMTVRNDTAVTRTGGWEQSYDATLHPAVAGIDDARNKFGVQLGSSIRTGWSARPVLVGRWGWSDPGSSAALSGVSYYNAGKPLGDLVLAAEEPLGRGRVFTLADASPLQNDSLPNAYPFVGRLFGYLANEAACSQDVWRQLLGLFSLTALVALLAGRPAAWQIMLASTVLSVALLCCIAVSQWSGRVLPDGREHSADGANNIAYIDASHLEAYDADPHGKRGLLDFLQTLMRQGYLPLFAYDATPERLERAGLLVSIGPGREFSSAECAAVKQFLGGGGTFLCMVGAEHARPIAPLLADLNFTVPPSPVAPGETAREPAPLGVQYGRMDESNRRFCYYAAWPVECQSPDGLPWSVWSDEQGKNPQPIIVSLAELGGSVVVIGDTFFAVNENIEPEGRSISSRILFWRWLLSRVVPGQKPWDLPADSPTEDET
jgi:hypothetical protein